MTKAAVRRVLNAATRALPADAVETLSQAICARLWGITPVTAAKNLGVYCAMPTAEVSLAPFIGECLRRGQTVWIPKACG